MSLKLLLPLLLVLATALADNEELKSKLRGALTDKSKYSIVTNQEPFPFPSAYIDSWTAGESPFNLGNAPLIESRSTCGGLNNVYGVNGVFDRRKLSGVTKWDIQSKCNDLGEVKWVWRRQEIGILNIPGSYYVVKRILELPDEFWDALLDATNQQDMEFGTIQLTRNEYLQDLFERPAKSALLQTMMFREVVRLAMTPEAQLHAAEKQFINYFVGYGYDFRIQTAIVALDIFYVWDTVRLLHQGENIFQSLFGYVTTPVDYSTLALQGASISAGTTAVTSLFGMALGAMQKASAMDSAMGKFDLAPVNKVTQNVGRSFDALKASKALNPQAATSSATRWITGVTRGARVLSFMKAVAGPVAIILAAVEAGITMLITIIKLNDALPNLLKIYQDLMRQVVQFPTDHLNKMRSRDPVWSAYKETALEEAMMIFARMTEGDGSWKTLGTYTAHRIENMYRSTVICDFTVDDILREVYLNGKRITDDVFGDKLSWQKTKSIRFVEPRDLVSSFVILGSEASGSSNQHSSGFQMKCRSDDTNSPWNFVSGVEPSWKFVRVDVNNFFGGAKWWVKGPIAEDAPVVRSYSTFHFADQVVPLLPEASKIWGTSDWNTMAFRKTVTRPLTRAVVTCRLTVDNKLHRFYVNNVDLTSTIQGNLDDWTEPKIIQFEEPSNPGKYCVAIKASSHEVESNNYNSGFSMECTSTNAQSDFHNLRTRSVSAPTKAPTNPPLNPGEWYFAVELTSRQRNWKAITSKDPVGDSFDWNWYRPNIYMDLPDAVISYSGFSLSGATQSPGKIWSSGTTKYVAFKRCWSTTADWDEF